MKADLSVFGSRRCACWLLAVWPSVASTMAEAACVVNIVGKWQQTHTMIQERRIPDESQAWTFKRDGSMRFVKTKPALTVDGKYQCEGDTISLFGRMTNQFKIVAHDADSMTWESKLGGTLLVKRVDR